MSDTAHNPPANDNEELVRELYAKRPVWVQCSDGKKRRFTPSQRDLRPGFITLGYIEVNSRRRYGMAIVRLPTNNDKPATLSFVPMARKKAAPTGRAGAA